MLLSQSYWEVRVNKTRSFEGRVHGAASISLDGNKGRGTTRRRGAGGSTIQNPTSFAAEGRGAGERACRTDWNAQKGEWEERDDQDCRQQEFVLSYSEDEWEGT